MLNLNLRGLLATLILAPATLASAQG
ncbi:MAG: hypothetical protein JWL81_3304, partial [Verrucomicrobiales bacterium]|nr:hypothetical protein [Verrucomicrobiales bacterium]